MQGHSQTLRTVKTPEKRQIHGFGFLVTSRLGNIDVKPLANPIQPLHPSNNKIEWISRVGYETDWLRVATAGKTVDGRTIQEQWLTDAARLYDAENEYKAQVWAWSHYFKYETSGYVTAAKTGRDKKGRLALFVKISPLPDLVQMNRQGQLQHASIEINPNYKDEGKAYLVGIVLTNNPASVGTQEIHLSAGQGAATMLSAPEQFSADLSDPAETTMPRWFEPFARLFTGKAPSAQPTEEDVIMTPEQFTKFEKLMTDQNALLQQNLDAAKAVESKLEGFTVNPPPTPAAETPAPAATPEAPKVPTAEEFTAMVESAVQKYMATPDGKATLVPKNDGGAVGDEWNSDV